jgi:lipopolysaccharide heptosyltransferase I
MSILRLPPRKILVIKPSAFGDIVHSLPFLYAVKRRHPQSELHWIAARGLHHFLEGHPLIDRIWVMDKTKWKQFSRLRTTAPEVIRFCRDLRREGFDITVDLSGLLRSGLISWITAAPCRLGFEESDEGSPLFYTHKIFGDMTIHALNRYLKLAKAMGCDISTITYPLPPFDPCPDICKTLPGEYGVMAPSAGKAANRWPEDRFGELAKALPIPTVIIASREDAGIAEAVKSRAGRHAVSLAGKTSLKELIPIIRNARYFISNDTGPMHLAAAVRTPVFAIFGPANPARTGPYGPGHTVIRQPMACSPCYRRRPCSHWRCMLDITPEQVLSVVKKRLRTGLPEIVSP